MDLRSLYESLEYPADVDGERIVLRHDRPCPELDRILERAGLESAAYLTAHHPHGRRAPAEANLAAQARLREQVSRYRAVEAPGGWPPGDPPDPDGDREPSLLVLGIPIAEAIAAARVFEQAGLVVHERGRRSRVVMLDVA